MPLLPFRILLPFVCRYTSPRFRRWAVERIPWAPLQKIRRIVDTMDEMSHAIYNAKMDAFRKGEEAVVQQIGEGKDVMSILRWCFSSSQRSKTDH